VKTSDNQNHPKQTKSIRPDHGNKRFNKRSSFVFSTAQLKSNNT